MIKMPDQTMLAVKMKCCKGDKGLEEARHSCASNAVGTVPDGDNTQIASDKIEDLSNSELNNGSLPVSLRIFRRGTSISEEAQAMHGVMNLARIVYSGGGDYETFLTQVPNLKFQLTSDQNIMQHIFDRRTLTETWWNNVVTYDEKNDPGGKKDRLCGNLASDENNDESCEEEQSETDKPVAPSPAKVLVPCRRCCMSICSNCLVPFKKGDKMVTRIPSTSREPVNGFGDGWVPLEVALICVFLPSNPYPRWIKSMEKAASLPTQLMELLENTFQKTEEHAENKKSEDDVEMTGEQKKVLEQFLSVLCSEVSKELEGKGSFKKTCLEMMDQKIKEIKVNKGPNKDTYLTPQEIKNYFIAKLDEYKADKEKEMKEAKLEITIRKIAEAANAKGELGMDEFQLCLGCAELLIVLFTAWEQLQDKKVTEESYYYAVMVGFRNSKKAQDGVFRAELESKMNVINKYAKECHPIGCLQRRSACKHVKFNLGETRQNLVKNAVGNLHGYLEESYRRVFNEFISDIDFGEVDELPEDEEEKSRGDEFEERVEAGDEFEKKLEAGYEFEERLEAGDEFEEKLETVDEFVKQLKEHGREMEKKMYDASWMI